MIWATSSLTIEEPLQGYQSDGRVFLADAIQFHYDYKSSREVKEVVITNNAIERSFTEYARNAASRQGKKSKGN